MAKRTQIKAQLITTEEICERVSESYNTGLRDGKELGRYDGWIQALAAAYVVWCIFFLLRAARKGK